MRIVMRLHRGLLRVAQLQNLGITQARQLRAEHANLVAALLGVEAVGTGHRVIPDREETLGCSRLPIKIA
jgi:hypothetical protein